MLHSVDDLLKRLGRNARCSFGVAGKSGFNLSEVRVVSDSHEKVGCAQLCLVALRLVKDGLEQLELLFSDVDLIGESDFRQLSEPPLFLFLKQRFEFFFRVNDFLILLGLI